MISLKPLICLGILISLVFSDLLGQSTVDLKARPLSELSSFSTPMPLYKLSGKSFMHYHVATDQQKKHPVRLPEGIGDDLAFFMSFFTGNEKSPINDYAVTIVDDYESANPKFYIDKNQNLDFSDDGDPLSWDEEAGLEVALYHKDNTHLPYLLNVSRISFATDASKQRVEESFGQGPETVGKTILPAKHWMSENRLNIIANDVIMASDSFKIGLVDWNSNGLYNEVGVDKISIGQYGSDQLNVLESSLGVQTQSEDNLFRWGENVYQIREINKGGSELVLKKMFDEAAPNKLSVGDALPDFTITTLKEGENSIAQHLADSKYTYLKFWASWCKRCIDEIPELKDLAGDYSKKLKVVGLNCADTEAVLKETVKKNKMKWTNGMASLDLLDLLLVDGIPHGILVDAEGKIVDLKISTLDLRLFLEQQTAK